MRTSFIRTLTELASRNPDVVLMTGDLGFTVFEHFRDTFPRQYLNAGVAEQNMVGMAAGMAMTGKCVFVYSIIPFATFRCLEQIRNDVCYHRLPVCIVGVGAGYAYGHQGSTHHALEDIAVLRSLPEMTVVCPGDPVETELAVRAILDRGQPAYLRLGKAGEPVVHASPPDFTIGKAIRLREGRDVALIATGTMLPIAQKAADLLASRNVSVRLLSMHTIKPLDADAVVAASKETRLIVTLEEHSCIGGLGSAVAECISLRNARAKAHLILSAPDAFAANVGSQQCLRGRAGLDAESVTNAIQDALGIPGTDTVQVR